MNKNKKTNGYISKDFYKKIVNVMPIPCVDMVIMHGKSFLLGKRWNEPVKGKWWLPGGRVMKSEKLTSAVRRKMREETGLPIKKMKFFTTDETMFRNSHFGVSTHTINSIFLVEVKRKDFKTDDQHAELKWFTKIDPRWHPYIKRTLKKSGFPK